MKTVFILFALIAVACALEDKTADKGDFKFKILGSGNQPKYHFSYGKSNKFQLEFNKLYECDDNGNTVNGNDVSMPSLAWAYTNTTNEVGGFQFRLTGTNSNFFDTLVLENHLRDDHIKFDFIITGMQWTSDTNKLCMQYRFHTSGKNDDSGKTEEEDGQVKAKLEGAEFGCVKYAQHNNGTVPVEMVVNNGKIVVIYDHFESDLTHDPSLFASAAWLLPTAFMVLLALLF